MEGGSVFLPVQGSKPEILSRIAHRLTVVAHGKTTLCHLITGKSLFCFNFQYVTLFWCFCLMLLLKNGFYRHLTATTKFDQSLLFQVNEPCLKSCFSFFVCFNINITISLSMSTFILKCSIHAIFQKHTHSA